MDLDERTGGSLRQELEATLAKNVALDAELHSMKIERVLNGKGYEFVSPDDLKGVPLDKVEQKAQEIEEAKRSESETMLRKALEARGWEADEIEETLLGTRTKVSQEDHETEQAHGRLRDLQGVTGTPLSKQLVGEGLEGLALIQSHFEDQSKRESRSRGRRT